MTILADQEDDERLCYYCFQIKHKDEGENGYCLDKNCCDGRCDWACNTCLKKEGSK